MAATIPFVKVEGLGNDFILLDRRDRSPAELERELPALRAAAPAWCDRHTGVGADGLLVVGPPAAAQRGPAAEAAMIVINHDGSVPEMCGNGLRAVALYVVEVPRGADSAPSTSPAARTVQIATGAGLRSCEVVWQPGSGRGDVRVDMGRARRDPDLSWPAPAFQLARVDMGNPHAIALVGPHDDPEQLARAWGPEIEVAPAFPARTNVEFARLEPDRSLTLWVWERGCGITRACGTGACATAAAAVDRGLVPAGEPVTVRLPGGALEIVVPADPAAAVAMRGPASLVFRGELPPARVAP
jgi:diaminopimelate epimerase